MIKQMESHLSRLEREVGALKQKGLCRNSLLSSKDSLTDAGNAVNLSFLSGGPSHSNSLTSENLANSGRATNVVFNHNMTLSISCPMAVDNEDGSRAMSLYSPSSSDISTDFGSLESYCSRRRRSSAESMEDLYNEAYSILGKYVTEQSMRN